jgi:hypothetical protein
MNGEAFLQKEGGSEMTERQERTADAMARPGLHCTVQQVIRSLCWPFSRALCNLHSVPDSRISKVFYICLQCSPKWPP